MKRGMLYFVFALILSLYFISCSETKKEVSKQQQEMLRSTADHFMFELKGVLVHQMQTKGIVAAVSVCSDTAQILTKKFGELNNVVIKRVSFKNRNAANYPDAYEQMQLKEFQSMYKQGLLDDNSEFADIITENGKEYLRYMKPIFVLSTCLNCHGSDEEISPEVKSIIAEKYPNDKAVGYKDGDLRGAVSIKRILD